MQQVGFNTVLLLRYRYHGEEEEIKQYELLSFYLRMVQWGCSTTFGANFSPSLISNWFFFSLFDETGLHNYFIYACIELCKLAPPFVIKDQSKGQRVAYLQRPASRYFCPNN